ncbi:reverse transcriptase domain-containing protein [Tanacetum coccineum]
MQSCYAFFPSHSLKQLKGGWTDYPQEPLTLGISLKKAIIQRYCQPSKTAKQLKEICNFKHEGDETLYQAWERNMDSNSNTRKRPNVSKLDSLGRDMKKLKENVHAIQLGFQTCRGAHLNKECPLNEEVKSMEEVKYGEFRRPPPFSQGNGAKYHVGPPGYYIHVDNLPPFGEKKPSLEELLNKHLEESTQRRAKMEEWVKKLQENMEEEDDVPSRVLPCQLPPKEFNPGSFTLPCTIGSLNFYAMADLVEMADMTKRAPIEIVENILVRIDKFLFPSDFIVINMLKTHNETMILARPFLETIYADIDIFNKEISLGIGDDKVTFDMDKKIHNFATHVGKVYMVNSILNNEPPNLLDISSNASSYEPPQFEKSENLHHQYSNDNYMQERSGKKARMVKIDTPSPHFYKPVKQDCNGTLKVWPTCDPTMKLCNGGNDIYGVDEHRTLKYWHYHLDNERKSMKGGGNRGYLTIRKRKQIKVQEDDPKRIGHAREGPKKDVEHLVTNLKTRSHSKEIEFEISLARIYVVKMLLRNHFIIMEYLVNISKKHAFWSLNEDILKITILITNTPYPSRKIQLIRACTHQRPQRPHDQYAVSREDQYAVLKI